jgi:hypothetical protein
LRFFFTGAASRSSGVERIGRERGKFSFEVADKTVRGVLYSTLGTALADQPMIGRLVTDNVSLRVWRLERGL